MYKELWDGFHAALERLRSEFPHIETGYSRQQVKNQANVLLEEFEHYCLFADVYDALRDSGDERLTPADIKAQGGWIENDQLMTLRSEHKREFGELGRRAHFFTEGGYCTLYSEGMKLLGNGGIEDMIAKACAEVYDEEFQLMLLGIVGLDQLNLSDSDWQQLELMTVAQMKGRIRMRNAQFSYPVSAQRIEDICQGVCTPMRFDFDRAIENSIHLAAC